MYLASLWDCRIARNVICGLSLQTGNPCQRGDRVCILRLPYSDMVYPQYERRIIYKDVIRGPAVYVLRLDMC